MADLVRREPVDLGILELDGATVYRVDGGDEVEYRRLAGAVRADEADDLFLCYREVQISDDLQTTEVLGDSAQRQKRRPCRHRATLPFRRRRKFRPRPDGRCHGTAKHAREHAHPWSPSP